MAQKATNILKLFDRPTEPSFMPKGDDNTVFQAPSKYLVNMKDLFLYF